MALEEKTFGQIKHEGDSFFVDNENEDKVRFVACGPEKKMTDFFIKNMNSAFDKACDAVLKEGENDSFSCSLDSILEVYEGLKKQAVEMAERKSVCKGELADFVNTLVTNLGKIALGSMFQKSKPKRTANVFDDNGDYKLYVDVKKKHIDVKATGFLNNLLLLDGTSVEQLLVPEATVLIRLRPAAEKHLADHLIVCCETLEGLIKDGVSDLSAILEKIANLTNENEKKCNELSKSASDSLRERGKFKFDSEEYAKLTTQYLDAYKEKNKIEQSSTAIRYMKFVLRDLYVPGAQLSVVKLKRETLWRILDSSYELWQFDVPGFVTRDDVKFLTTCDAYKISGNQTLNGAPLGNDSFYVRAADLRPFDKIFEIL